MCLINKCDLILIKSNAIFYLQHQKRQYHPIILLVFTIFLTCSCPAVESRISVRVSPGWNRITSTMSLLVLKRHSWDLRLSCFPPASSEPAALTYFSRSVLASVSALASPGRSNLLVRVRETSVFPISSLLGSFGGRGFSPEGDGANQSWNMLRVSARSCSHLQQVGLKAQNVGFGAI